MSKHLILMHNYGIDLLRIISMFCIIVLHILNHGGIISTVENGLSFQLLWLLEIIAYPAVCCFMIISGFVGYRDNSKSLKLYKIISLYIIVLFYSVILAVVMKLIFPQYVSYFDVIVSMFPIITKRYWFFTSYFIVFIFSQLINSVVYNFSSKILSFISIVIFFLGSVEVVTQVFGLSSGYSFVWMAFLYYLGALIKKYNLFDIVSIKFALYSICGAMLITWSIKMMFPTMNFDVAGINVRPGNIFISYCSPTILVMSLGWVSIFYKIKLPTIITKLVTFFSTSAFSVYLIHDNEIVRNLFIKNKYIFMVDLNPFLILVGIFLCALIMFLCCILIDKLRISLFKLFKIDILSNKLEEIFYIKYDYAFNKLKRWTKYE